MASAWPNRPAYVANFGSGTVTPIRTATNTALSAIKIGNYPGSLAITPNGKTVYVASYGGPGAYAQTVTPISTATNKPGKAITVGTGPTAIAISP